MSRPKMKFTQLEDKPVKKVVRCSVMMETGPCTSVAAGERDGKPICGKHAHFHDRRKKKEAAQ